MRFSPPCFIIIAVDINAVIYYIVAMKTTEALLEATAKLYKHRGRIDIKLDELVGIANELINLVVPRQPSDRVAEILNERSLRYYITEGLIDRPVGKEGTAALYGYRHLLQALIVKALQGAYLPIKRIREILTGKNDRELEAILACQVEIPAGQDSTGHIRCNGGRMAGNGYADGTAEGAGLFELSSRTSTAVHP